MNENLFLKFLYDTLLGRLILKILVNPTVSKLCGHIMNSRLSTIAIPGFIKKNNINMEEYINERYSCFNDFFTRKIKAEERPIDTDNNHLISPCDSYLSVYDINKETKLPIKKSIYTIEELIKNKNLAKEYENGKCLVFRLCPNHYHRYIYIDNGYFIESKHINGVLHTVRPIACKKYKVFTENTREYTVLDTDNLGKIIQMEIGAMMVGKIDNYPAADKILRGQEKGKFLFGGSTIVLIVKPGIISLEETQIEKAVKIGQSIDIINNVK